MTNLAQNDRWQVERVGSATGDRIELLKADGSRQLIASVKAPAQLGRPALDGDRLVFHQAGRFLSKIFEVELTTGALRTLRSTHTGVMLNPTLSGDRLLYVHSTFEYQRMKFGTRGGGRSGKKDKIVFSMVPTARRDKGYEPGHHAHAEGYKNGFGRRLPVRPGPGVVETLWEPAFAATGATVSLLRHRVDGGVDVAMVPVTL